jgi:hypothetical protein
VACPIDALLFPLGLACLPLGAARFLIDPSPQAKALGEEIQK